MALNRLRFHNILVREMDAPSPAATELAEVVDEGITSSTRDHATKQDVRSAVLEMQVMVHEEINRLLKWGGRCRGGNRIRCHRAAGRLGAPRWISNGTRTTLSANLLRRSLEHHPRSPTFHNKLASLIDSSMLERHDSSIRAAAGLSTVDNLRLTCDRVADEDGVGERRFVEAQVPESRAKRGVSHAQAHGQAEREDAVHDPLSELRTRREFSVEMQRLRIVRQRGEQQVVGPRSPCATADA